MALATVLRSPIFRLPEDVFQRLLAARDLFRSGPEGREVYLSEPLARELGAEHEEQHHPVPQVGAERDPDLAALAVLAQFENRDGMLVEVPASPPLAADTGVRYEGRVLQVGLTRDEIDGVSARIAALLAQVDAGEIPLFDSEETLHAE